MLKIFLFFGHRTFIINIAFQLQVDTYSTVYVGSLKYLSKNKKIPCAIRPPTAQKRTRRRNTALCRRRRGPAAQRLNGTAAARTSVHAPIPGATLSSDRRFGGAWRLQERTASTCHREDFSRRRRNTTGFSWVRIL
jgi:hypothetical protein